MRGYFCVVIICARWFRVAVYIVLAGALSARTPSRQNGALDGVELTLPSKSPETRRAKSVGETWNYAKMRKGEKTTRLFNSGPMRQNGPGHLETLNACGPQDTDSRSPAACAAPPALPSGKTKDTNTLGTGGHAGAPTIIGRRPASVVAQGHTLFSIPQ